jgi:glycosyltransferase involved in cell wall biosynthesis
MALRENMPTVALLYDRYHPQIGGIERMMAEVAARLTASHRMIVVAEAFGQLPKISQDLGYSVLRCTKRNPPPESILQDVDLVLGFGYTPYSPRCLFPIALARIVLQRQIPLAWCPTFYPANISRTGERNRPYWKRLIPGPLRGLARASLNRSYRKIFSKSSTLFALTEREQGHWETLFPSQRVRLVPHGIGSEHRACTDKRAAKRWMKERFGPGPHITSVGRFVSHKNQQVVMHAIPEIRRHFPSAQLILVGPHHEGTGPALQQLSSSPELAGMISFTGRVSEEDLCQLYAGSTLLVHPSRHEASGLTLVEALAHGTAVLHSGYGALERYDCLSACYRVSEPEIPSSWAGAVAALLCDSQSIEQSATRGRQAVLDGHSWDTMAEAVAKEVDLVGARS